MLQNNDSVSCTISTTTDIGSSNDCNDCKEKNKLLETLRYGLSFSDRTRYASFFGGIERYGLNPKTKTTNGSYIYGNLTNQYMSSVRSTISLDSGFMFGLKQFDNDKKNYFEHTRSDDYVKFGTTTNLNDVNEFYTGYEVRRDGLRSFLKAGVGIEGGQIKPIFGLGFSVDLDHCSDQ